MVKFLLFLALAVVLFLLWRTLNRKRQPPPRQLTHQKREPDRDLELDVGSFGDAGSGKGKAKGGDKENAGGKDDSRDGDGGGDGGDGGGGGGD